MYPSGTTLIVTNRASANPLLIILNVICPCLLTTALSVSNVNVRSGFAVTFIPIVPVLVLSSEFIL